MAQPLTNRMLTRLPGLLAQSPYWLIRANASSHFCSTSPSRSPNPGGRARSERGKPPSPPAVDKLGSSRVALFSNRGSKEAKAKGKPSSSQTTASADKGISSSASKPASQAKAAKAKVAINDRAQVSSDHHAPAEFPTSHYHAKRSADLLKNSILEDNCSTSERSHGGMPLPAARVHATDRPIKSKWSRRALSSKNSEIVDGDDRNSSAKVAHYAHIQEDRKDAVKSIRPSKYSIDDANDASILAKRVAPATKARKEKPSRKSSGKIAHHACIQEDPIYAVKSERPSKDLLAESLENGDDANDASILAKRVAPAKRAQKHARGGHTIPCTECGPLHFKGKTRMQSRICQADAEISAHSGEIQILPKAKPSRKSSESRAKAKASVVSEGVPIVSIVSGVDGKCQDSNSEDAKAAAGIPEVSSILGENPGLEFLDVQASEKSFVNVQGPPNQDVTIEARHLFDEFPVQYKAEITIEGHAAGPTLVKESQKASLLVAFPINILARWWISCYMKSTVAFTDLTHPLDMTHVWITAYQRAFSKLTGKYCNGETIRSVIKKLRDLQFTLARGKFKWADQQHVHLPSPITDTAKNSKTSSEVFISSAFQDDVVEEVLLLVLEPIFEARFSARSHAFRPGRDAHTALCMVMRSFQGCAWFISGKLHSQSIYSTRVLDSVMRVVRDMRVASLVKIGLLRDKWMELEMEELDKAGRGSNRDLSMRLKFLLWNVFLDQLDQWMEKRIHSLSERKQLICRSSSSLLFRSDTIAARKTPKMEYVRYGTNFLVGFYGSQKEAETLREDCLRFLKQDMGVNLDRVLLPLLHISSGVKFLDHIISQKVVHPITSRRSASSGRIFEKRALRIRLSLKASRRSCLSYLHQIGSPASFEEIKEILAIVNNWYLYAEDRVKTTEFCKLLLCRSYVKEVLGEQQEVQMDKAFLESVKEAMRMVMDDPIKEKDHSSDRGKCISKDGIWLSEHEMNLKELAWLESKVAMIQAAKDFRHRSTLSPQQHTVQVVWDFLKGSYPFRGDYFWEPETWVHLPGFKEGSSADVKSEELSECAV